MKIIKITVKLLILWGVAQTTTVQAQKPVATPSPTKPAIKIQPRPESGPFGNITSKPGAVAPVVLTLAPVEGQLADDSLRDAQVPSAFASGRLVYFISSTLQSTNNPANSSTPVAINKEATVKTPASDKNKRPPVASKSTQPPRPIQGYFLVERTFAKDKALIVKLYQVRSPQKVRPEAPLFFPDGKKLLFQVDDGSRGPNSYRLYVVDLADKSAKRLELDAIAIRSVDISPDGRYLAIVGAGAMGERGWNPQAAPQLFVYDLQTGKSRDLLKNDLYNRLPLGAAWSSDNKLLFSLAPAREEAAPLKDDKGAAARMAATAGAPVLSTIYETTVDGEPQRLFGGYNPLPSPDGKWLSFIGLMDVNQPNYLMPHICLFDRKTLKRYTGLPSINSALWTPDSRQLIIGESLRQDGVPNLRLYSVGLDKWQTQAIATVPLQSPTYLAHAGQTAEKPIEKEAGKETIPVAASTTASPTAKPRPPFTAQWKPLLISPDGSTLYAQIKTYSAPDNHGLSREVWNLQALNLRDGSTSLLGALPDASGVAWFMDTPTSAAQTAP